jgi:hypothetical protein
MEGCNCQMYSNSVLIHIEHKRGSDRIRYFIGDGVVQKQYIHYCPFCGGKL